MQRNSSTRCVMRERRSGGQLDDGTIGQGASCLYRCHRRGGGMRSGTADCALAGLAERVPPPLLGGVTAVRAPNGSLVVYVPPAVPSQALSCVTGIRSVGDQRPLRQPVWRCWVLWRGCAPA